MYVIYSLRIPEWYCCYQSGHLNGFERVVLSIYNRSETQLSRRKSRIIPIVGRV